MNHVGDKIQAYVAGELSGPVRRDVAEHLARCPECAQDVEVAQQLWAMLGEGDVPGTSRSAWPDIRARTFDRETPSLLFGGGLWRKTGFAAAAVAAGLVLAILLPVGNVAPALVVADGEVAGSSFWFGEETETTFSELWLAVADEGSES